LPAGLFFDSVQLADIVQGLLGKAFGVDPLCAVFFAHRSDFDKLAPRMGPTAQVHDTGLLIQMIVAAKIIGLDVAFVVVQKSQRCFAAATALILIYEHRTIRRPSPKNPHIGCARIFAARLV
jgi:hypothetical protein